MNKFNMGGRGNRGTEFAGRPKADANYGQKKRFNNDTRREGGNRYNDRGPKEAQLFKATCTTCSKPCEVPFRPDGQKPVLCRDCFAAKNSSPLGNDYSKKSERNFESGRTSYKPENRGDSFNTKPTPNFSANHGKLLKQVESLEIKVSEILSLLKQQRSESQTILTKNFDPIKVLKKGAPKKLAKPKKIAKKATKKIVKK